MKKLTLVLLSIILVECVSFAGNNEKLVGRWISDFAPTGYWIIDRYQDGRFAEKCFLSFDYNQPSEVCANWGRWKISHGKYSDVIDGTTSNFLKKFLGKWSHIKIVSMSSDRFVFLSSDGEDRTEKRLSSKTSLLEIIMKKTEQNPSDACYKVVSQSFDKIPAWVNGCSTNPQK